MIIEKVFFNFVGLHKNAAPKNTQVAALITCVLFCIHGERGVSANTAPAPYTAHIIPMSRLAAHPANAAFGSSENSAAFVFAPWVRYLALVLIANKKIPPGN